MGDTHETTTTTTTEGTTTTTTTERDQNNTTTTTTVDAGQAAHAPAEKQGEQVIDKSADAHQLKEQSADERLDEAKAEGLRNHAVEHAGDTESAESLASNDRVDEK